MLKSAFIFFTLLVNSLLVYSQVDSLPVIGVAKFTSESDSKFVTVITKEVIEILVQSNRFQVVDRTNYSTVKEELELQKSEEFIDSKKRAAQGMELGAQHLVTGNVIKLNVYAMKNVDGSINGYKSSMSFQLQISDVSTGRSSKAVSFQSKVSPLMLSAESAVNDAVKSLDNDLIEWVNTNFPIQVKLLKILTTQSTEASTILITGGKSYGLKIGDVLLVQKNEKIEGQNYPTEIGKVKITKLAGESFAECLVKTGGEQILTSFKENSKIVCIKQTE